MTTDEKPELSMPEFMDALERGKRTYECYKHAIEIAKRLANHEQVERELLDRVTLANAQMEKAEAACKEACLQCDDEVTKAKGRSLAALDAVKKDETAKLDAIRSETKRQSDSLLAELNEISAKVAAKKAELDAMTRQSVELGNDIRKLEKQLANAREAKNALLQA